MPSAYQDLLFWAEATQRSIRSWQRDLAAADDDDGNIPRRLLALADTARDAGPGDGIRLPPRPRTQAAGHRLSGAGGRAR